MQPTGSLLRPDHASGAAAGGGHGD